MPRRQTFSAAGALAAALLAASAMPAAAQNAGVPPLRGSIGAQDADEDQPTLPSLQRRRQPGQGGVGTSADGTSPDIATPTTDPTKDPSLFPAEPQPPPPLGGLGDEEAAPVARAPGPGITTAAGLPLLRAPRVDDDDLKNLPLPPEGHLLDPFVPIGTRVGSFLLFTEAEIGTILTDNVLATRTDTHSDHAFEFAPNVNLISNWSRHFFNARFSADRSWYKNFPVEDDKTYQALLRGRLDATRRTNLGLELGKSQTQEGRSSISLTDIAGLQTNVQEEHITGSAEHTFNRLTLRVEGTVAQYEYEDPGALGIFDPTIPTVIPQQDVRDYREDELRLRGSYEFNPDLAVFVQGEISREVYKQPVSVDGITRDSNGFEILTGANFAFSDALFGELSLGWGEQTSIDESVAPIEGFLLNADIIWMPTPMTMMEFLARTQVSTTTLVDSLGAVDRFYELSLQHAFWRYLVVRGFVSYEIADFAGTTQVDQRVKEGASAEYYFNPNVSVYARYEHTDFISSDPASDFKMNEVRIGMRIRN